MDVGFAKIQSGTANLIQFINLADYETLTDEIYSTISTNINISHLKLRKLQILLSGAKIPIDLEDLKRNCKYGGDYNPEHRSIVAFWCALESFDDMQKQQLLKFVISCSRPPLLGFKD
uniref:HECT-type E3 ubiquitin transferase n=1 Tax=Glossina austeni TaxID=7395 RepID=A0A1A9UER4_GLOAU